MTKTLILLGAAMALCACGSEAQDEAAQTDAPEAIEEEAPEYSFLPHGAPLFPDADESTAEEHAVFRDSYEYQSNASKLEIAQFYGDYITQSGSMRVISAGIRTASGQRIGINGNIVNAYRADDESFNANLTSGITATIPIHPEARTDTLNANDEGNTPYVSYQVDDAISSMDLLAFYEDAFRGQDMGISEMRITGQGESYRPNLAVTIRDAMGGGHSVVVKATGFTPDGQPAGE
ncbi:hypothetical protein HFP51_01295 [Parasphingopyxis sp. CP4]|uniref:hypothetical protein n=1 Tax=Parasphingopyxis sp. CP4 TaxID=2724527 RepID=UPI0015A3F163|nr:hypothetical protein [Parasphingopyxis sp. CP4]QLC20939.1 hypothetical protein HFP51_01295 [Parasphingopyxis sp. CP4]